MGRMPDRCPGHPLLSLRSRVPLASRRGRFCLNRGLRRWTMMARALLSAFTLTPGSSPGQALALSHRGRGDGVVWTALSERGRMRECIACCSRRKRMLCGVSLLILRGNRHSPDDRCGYQVNQP